MMEAGVEVDAGMKTRLCAACTSAYKWAKMKNEADDSGLGECLGLLELCEVTVLPKLD